MIKKIHQSRGIISSKIPTGTRFEGTIGGTKVEGLVYNDQVFNKIYLCQNSRNGQRSPYL